MTRDVHGRVMLLRIVVRAVLANRRTRRRCRGAEPCGGKRRRRRRSSMGRAAVAGRIASNRMVEPGSIKRLLRIRIHIIRLFAIHTGRRTASTIGRVTARRSSACIASCSGSRSCFLLLLLQHWKRKQRLVGVGAFARAALGLLLLVAALGCDRCIRIRAGGTLSGERRNRMRIRRRRRRG